MIQGKELAYWVGIIPGWRHPKCIIESETLYVFV